jgi:hypothetical protein
MKFTAQVEENRTKYSRRHHCKTHLFIPADGADSDARATIHSTARKFRKFFLGFLCNKSRTRCQNILSPVPLGCASLNSNVIIAVEIQFGSQIKREIRRVCAVAISVRLLHFNIFEKKERLSRACKSAGAESTKPLALQGCISSGNKIVNTPPSISLYVAENRISIQRSRVA